MSESDERHVVRDALFLDIPYIVDSFCRHMDYALNRLHRPSTSATPPEPRSYTALPPFALFVAVLFFAAYGPTLDSLCGVIGAKSVEGLRDDTGLFFVALAIVQVIVGSVYFFWRVQRRFRKQQVFDNVRKTVVCVVLFLVIVVWSLPFYFFGQSLQDTLIHDACRPQLQVWPPVVQLVLFVVAAVACALTTRRDCKIGTRVICQGIIVIALVVALWVLPGIDPRSEAAQVPYRHVFAVITVGFAVIAMLSTCLVKLPFNSMRRKERKQVQDALASVELFPDSRIDPQLSPRRIIGGCVIGILRQPLLFVLLPAFTVSLVPAGFLWHALIVGTLASALLTTAANLTTRWDQMTQYIRRYFLLGTPLVVSGAVIVVAALRLGGVQYVTTVLNVAPFGVLFTWIVMAYVLSWWFEYQVNSVLVTKLLWVLGTPGDREDRLVNYAFNPPAGSKRTAVADTSRFVAAHAVGHFVVLGQITENETGKLIPAFETYAYVEFFEKILGPSDPGAAREIGRRVELYFALVNILIVLGLGALGWHMGRDDRLNTVMPVLTAQWPLQPDTGSAKHADLAALLEKAPGQQESAIVVAASGGGTRAAMYTASVLEGLHKIQVDPRIVLLSGVSGGGVAAAYFYGHRTTLISGAKTKCGPLDDDDKDPWDCYLDRMAMPFIGDVLEGASEWRIQSEQPLGVLLAESFERRLFSKVSASSRASAAPASFMRLGMDPTVGLILNTTIAGHPVQDSPMIDGTVFQLPQSPDLTCEQRDRPISALAGGRLAFSNLLSVGAFQKSDDDLAAIQMPFVVVRDLNVGLAQTAALNANFPPVFPNARVNLRGFGGKCDVRSYFVTDGGATENLGLISALLAIESAIDKKPGPFRDIDIVLSEASALDVDYQQDHGLGAATGQSKERLAGRLTLELLDQLRDRIKPAVIRVHDLSLPRVFRSRGGFGTHWMFPRSVQVDNPLETPLPPMWMRVVSQFSGTERYWVTLDATELKTLWRGLYDEQDFCEHPWTSDDSAELTDLTTVASWICGQRSDKSHSQVAGPDQQPAHWKALKDQLRIK